MASRPDVSRISVDGVFEYLAQMLDQDIVARESIEAFRESRINGESFLELTDDDLRELIPKLGERKAVLRLIKSFRPQQPINVVCFSYVFKMCSVGFAYTIAVGGKTFGFCSYLYVKGILYTFT